MAATTELGKAYVQIIPSAKGISGKITEALGGESASAGQAAGESWAQKLVSSAKKALAAAGLGKVLLDTVREGAALEQALGGVETLYGNAADTIKAYAKDAFRTAGLSANDYMEQSTSFAAALVSSLSGDTAAAAEAANTALTDMSDNANKMGTDMEAIQNAYQGFAKGNYTMLDNLKLGYGGTKTEMERLLKDAQKLTGVKYDISNLADVYSAIHAVQVELGISGLTAERAAEAVASGAMTQEEAFAAMGTTAKEAATTLSGSFAAMRAAASNVLGALTIGDGEMLKNSLNGLADTAVTFLVGNLMPALGNILSALPDAAVTLVTSLAASLQAQAPGLLQSGVELLQNIVSGIVTGLPQLLQSGADVIAGYRQAISEQFPQILESGSQMLQNLVNGILNNLPNLLSSGLELIGQLVGVFLDCLPQLLQSGVQLILSLVDGVIQSLPQVASAAFTTIAHLAASLLTRAPDILQSGITLIGELAAGLVNAIPRVVSAAGQIISDFMDKFSQTDWLSLGKAIIDGIIAGIRNAMDSLGGAIRDVADSALNAAKNALGIHSPSTLFRDEIGKQIPAGMALGIEEGAPTVRRALQSLTFGLEAAVPVRTAAAPLGNTPALAGGGFVQTNSFTFHINESLTPAELTREAEDMAVRLRWKLP